MFKKTKTLITIMLFAIGCAMSSIELAAQSTDEVYQQAYDLFDQNEFSNALTHFESLRATDPDNPALIYNIALCHQSLKQFQQADTFFSQLVDDKTYGDWAIYQLAMMDWQQGFLGAAEIGFTQVVFSSDDVDLVELATLRYEQLLDEMLASNQGPAVGGKTWFGSLGLSLGSDDNIVESRFLSASDQDDTFTEISGSLLKEWKGDDGQISWQGRAFALFNRYDEIDSADIGLITIGLDKYFYATDWQFALGLELEQSDSGGDDYLGTSAVNISARSHYRVYTQGWYVNLRYADIRALDNSFEQLTGTSRDLDLEYRIPLGDSLMWTIGGSLSSENKDPFINANNQSVNIQTDLSADRTGLSTTFVALLKNWRIEASYDVRSSNYGDIVLFGSNPLVTRRVSRDDERTRIVIRTDYEFNNTLSLYAEAVSLDNDSNVGLFQYKQKTISTGLNWNF